MSIIYQSKMTVMACLATRRTLLDLAEWPVHATPDVYILFAGPALPQLGLPAVPGKEVSSPK